MTSYNEALQRIKQAKENNATRIDLSFLRLEKMPPEIGWLSNLRYLYSLGNQLIDISPMKNLTKLTNLNLSRNQLIDISPLRDLTNLKSLALSSNKIIDISPLKDLTNLTKLDLGGNQLINISTLKELTNLMELYLNANKIIDILPLKDLTKLSILYIDGNQLTDISPLKYLMKLTILYLGGNQLNDISPLKHLANLTKLNLGNNQLNDISPLKELTNLTELYLYNNQLSDISPIKDLFIKDNIHIDFVNNPIQVPPHEILERGKAAVRNYFEQLKVQQKDYIFEAKLLIVGEPGAGKTSMAWKIENSDCDLPREEETTKGVDVRQYYFPLRKDDFPAFKYPEKLKNRKFRVNLWDFGGQEIYKATHRFFLSKRSLYALLADSRNEDTDFNYWLHIVEIFGGESPLLIVFNEKYGRKRNIDISAYQKRFTNISETIHVDFAEKDKSRLENLKKFVRFYISQLPHVGSPVPAKWTVVREALEQDKRNTISLQEYLGICNKNGITKSQDALVLSQYFHDIGVFLHFQDDELLNKTIFLKPNWATNAVYKILDHELLNIQNGRFNKDDARKIWCEEEYMFICDELLKLMQKFFLTYEIDHKGEYIVPERLQATQPKYDWNEKYNLFLRYAYDLFMPKGIMSQFIVQMHRYISNHDKVWNKGVVLERDNTQAEIIESYDARTIKIRVSGKNKRDFMTIITEQLDQINFQYEKMKVDKMIPCNCSKCKTDIQPYFFEYDKLKRRLDNNIYEIDCENSFKKVNIRSLIDEVIDEDRKIRFEEFSERATKIRRDKIFVSYSHKNSDALERVQTHLKVLENEGISINLWDDTQIKSGMKWREEIEKALESAKVAILLVSTDFLVSDFITKNELPPLLKAAENDGATILPLILKPCRFTKNKELSEFQAVNDPLKPFSKLTEAEQDEILLALTDRIEELMKE